MRSSSSRSRTPRIGIWLSEGPDPLRLFASRGRAAEGAKGARVGYSHNGSSPCSAMASPVTLASNRGRPRGLASRRCPCRRLVVAFVLQ